MSEYLSLVLGCHLIFFCVFILFSLATWIPSSGSRYHLGPRNMFLAVPPDFMRFEPIAESSLGFQPWKAGGDQPPPPGPLGLGLLAMLEIWDAHTGQVGMGLEAGLIESSSKPAKGTAN